MLLFALSLHFFSIGQKNLTRFPALARPVVDPVVQPVRVGDVHVFPDAKVLHWKKNNGEGEMQIASGQREVVDVFSFVRFPAAAGGERRNANKKIGRAVLLNRYGFHQLSIVQSRGVVVLHVMCMTESRIRSGESPTFSFLFLAAGKLSLPPPSSSSSSSLLLSPPP